MTEAANASWDAMSDAALKRFDEFWRDAVAKEKKYGATSIALTGAFAELAVLMNVMRQMSDRIRELEEALTQP